MKKWQVTDIRWAQTSELDLPFWKKWNKENPLPNGFWQRIWEYPYVSISVPKDGKTIDVGGTYPFVLFKNFPNAVSVDNRNLNKIDHYLHKGKWSKNKLIISDATKVPVKNNSYDYAISISAIEEMPGTVAVLKEMIRIAKQRVVVTMDVSEELGVNRDLVRKLEKFLNVKLPPIPYNVLKSTSEKITEFSQSKLNQYKHIRVLGIVIDAKETKNDIAILIPHWESYPFAKACLESIEENKNKNINHYIYLLDDNSKDGSFEKLKKEFVKNKNISFHKINRPDHKTSPDVGLVLDEGLKKIKEQYVAMIDADTMAISKDWLSFPIWLLNKFRLSSVDLDTGLSHSYVGLDDQKQSWWQPNAGYSVKGGIYDWFACTNNLYRVMRTADAKVVSENIGFTRSKLDYWSRMIDLILKKLSNGKKYLNPRAPYLPPGCDNGVAANHFIDINKMGAKFNIPLTSYIGLTDNDGAFGQNISDLVFHFALSTRALSSIRREVNKTGEKYTKWINKILENNIISTKTKNEMIKESKKFKRGGYDGSIPVKWYKNEYKYIQNLIKEYKKDTNK